MPLDLVEFAYSTLRLAVVFLAVAAVLVVVLAVR